MKNFALLMTLLCLLILTCCQQGTEQTPESYQAEVCAELLQLDMAYFEAWENEDLETCMSYYDKDFINMFAYGPVRNLEECRESYQDVFDNYSIEGVKWERTECFVDNNMAFETGLFEQIWITNDQQDTISFKMRGMTVYRKQEDGSWKQFRLIAQQ